MKANFIGLLIGCWSACSPAWGQWQFQPVSTTANFRAVSVVSATIVWVGGSGGTFLRTTDGGQTWQTGTVPGAESCDFRVVHGFSGQRAILVSAGPAENGQARIYQTTNGGQTWTLRYQTSQRGVFFDGLQFWNRHRGLVFSDPVDGSWVLLRTRNGGRTWHRLAPALLPALHPGEAAFAASNSSLAVYGRRTAWLASGGPTSGARVFRSTDEGRTWAVAETPMPASSTAGLFGLQFWSATAGLAVGGDYKQENQPGPNVLLTQDGGQTWQLVPNAANPPGLKEATAVLPGGGWLVAGPSGTSLSTDAGRTWRVLGSDGFHALGCAGTTCWAVGAKGRVAKQVFSR